MTYLAECGPMRPITVETLLLSYPTRVDPARAINVQAKCLAYPGTITYVEETKLTTF